MNLLGDKFSGKELSILKDTFAAANITRIYMVWSKSQLFPGRRPVIYATIEFFNGDTKGEQEIKADTMGELLTRVQAFIETLPKNA